MIIERDEVTTNHTKFIRICLDMSVNDSLEEKVKYAKILYDYMTHEALDFIFENLTFKSVAVKKAYELKNESFEFPDLENSLNFFLISIGDQ